MIQPHFKTALVLSGGSARALAHLGVLQELEKHDLQVDLIVGTSMGAIIGALYAYYGNIGAVLDRMRQLVGSDLFLRAVSAANKDEFRLASDSFINRFVWLFKSGIYCTQSVIQPTMVSEEDYLKIMSDLIPEYPMESLTLPFATVAMDLASGEEVVLTRGSLLKAVSASSAIPGILPPVRHEGRTLVDGGWVDNVPVAPAISLGAHCVIAVDAALDLNDLGSLPTSALETLLRAHEISRIFLNNHRKSAADIILVPKVGKMHWANFAALEPCMEAGRKAVEAHLLHIQLQQKKRRAVTRGGAIHPGRTHHWSHPFVIL